MSKKFKSQASSTRAATAFGSTSFGFGTSTSSSLSYIAEQPDLSGISDPKVVVCLRNLGKKDSTTKTKAIEELQELALAEVEDAVLSAWVDLYPRTSIDNSRRVRLLAHTLQGSFTAKAGKRIAPFLSKAVGPWLCGLYDNDRGVTRAVEDSLSQAFSTEEKRTALWKVYRESLLDHAEDAILIQTVQTLSDERSTSKDDAESKRARAAGSAVSMLGDLLKVNSESSPDFRGKLSRILANNKLWELVYDGDPYLRRSASILAIQCVPLFRSELDWRVLSNCFIAKGLNTSQIGSIMWFSYALLILTQTRPEIWTSDYHGKTNSINRLLQYLRRGSQHGNEQVWRNHATLIKIVLPDDYRALIDAVLAGVTNKEEPRNNLPTAWSCYLDVCYWCLSRSSQNEQESFLDTYLVPMVHRYVDPTIEGPAFPRGSALELSTEVLQYLAKRPTYEDALVSLFTEIYDRLIETMKVSQPQNSKNYSTSQDSVLDQSQRLFKLKRDLLEGHYSEHLAQCLSRGDGRLLEAAVELLRSRNGRPYGAAGILLDLVSQLTSLSTLDQGNPTLLRFLDDDLQSLLQSPSADRLVKLSQMSKRSESSLLSALLNSSPLNSDGKKALATILETITFEDAESQTRQISHLFDSANGTFSQADTTGFTRALLRNPSLSQSPLVEACVNQLLANLSSDAGADEQRTALQFLDTISADSVAKSVLMTPERTNLLLPRLLMLSDSEEQEVSDRASNLMLKFKAAQATTSDNSATLDIIVNQLAGAPQSLSILSLVELASTEANSNLPLDQTARLLPSRQNWETALQPHLQHTRHASLSITSPLQGAIYDISGNARSAQMPRDEEGFAMAFRLALYVSKLLSASNIFESLNDMDVRTLYEYYPLAIQLVNEKLTLESSNDIWVDSTPEVVDEAAEVLAQGNALMQTWIVDDRFVEIWLSDMRTPSEQTPQSYVSCLVTCDTGSRLAEGTASASVASRLDIKKLDVSNLLQAATVAYCLQDHILSSEKGQRVLNELISKATEVPKEMNSGTVIDAQLQAIILLNVLLYGESDPLDNIPSTRLVFLMQNTVRRLLAASSDDEHSYAHPEILKLLTSLLPAVGDIYGDHWRQILEAMCEAKNHSGMDEFLPTLHASLRLYQKLKAMSAGEEANEDLQDAWKVVQPMLEQTFLECLSMFEKPSAGANQPREITISLLGRVLSTAEVQDLGQLISLMDSSQDALLKTVYKLLHKAIPLRQEEVSLGLILDKQIITLPVELLELVSSAPAASDSISGLRRYLLSWRLIFDHFENASYKLKEMYLADLKTDASRISGLLGVICDKIRITSGRPVDASKFEVEAFDLDTSESEEREVQWLSIHLYYCCLLHAPASTKSWFLEQKNRIKSPLEGWTQKHISPTIMAAALATVGDWAQTQDQDDNPVLVKTNPRSFELVASMAIDPESPPIAINIVLPGSYPLESPNVTDRTRVGVSEKKWQSWLNTIRIIIFSTGSMVEGLIAFRRNVQGALKGQGECAICYSIIGTDMQTPNKKCGTCKNTFHGACLFRWFKSSNSSTCPLCRNSFSYA